MSRLSATFSFFSLEEFIMIFRNTVVAIFLLSSPPLLAQQKFSKAIEDNSFLIEEAYNQEERVIQHISNAVYFQDPQHDVAYTFTQELPIGGQRHQLSFTIPYAFLNSNSVNGVGDMMINYRYQLFTSNDWAAVAPRISIVLPTGNVNKNLGLGTAGVQVNLPTSKRLSDFFAAHFNIGFTFLPAAQAPNTINGFQADKHKLTWYNFGGSIIWLAGKKFNFMLEYLMNIASNIDEFGSVNNFTEKIFSPGVRCAIDIGELQIVPGLGFPFSFSSRQAGTRVGMIFYLSFEHPF